MKQDEVVTSCFLQLLAQGVDDLLRAKTSAWPSTGRQASIAGSPLLGARCGPVAKLSVDD